MKRTVAPLVSAILLCLGISPLYASIVDELEPNNSAATAQRLDGHFLIRPDVEVESGPGTNFSSFLPHVTINGQSSADVQDYDFYSFTARAGDWGLFDIDHFEFPDTTEGDSWIRLFDSDGTTSLADNDDSAFDGPGDQDPQNPSSSVDTLNSFLKYQFSADGIYYLRVGEYSSGSDGPLFSDGPYTLHVSIGTVPLPPAVWLFGCAAGILLGLRRVKFAHFRQV